MKQIVTVSVTIMKLHPPRLLLTCCVQLGTGSSPDKVARYAKENLHVYLFVLSSNEVDIFNHLSDFVA